MDPLDSIKKNIADFFSEATGLREIDNELNLFEQGIVNSLFAIQLMTHLEKSFQLNITMEDLDIKNFHSIAATAAFVDRKKRLDAR